MHLMCVTINMKKVQGELLINQITLHLSLIICLPVCHKVLVKCWDTGDAHKHNCNKAIEDTL